MWTYNLNWFPEIMYIRINYVFLIYDLLWKEITCDSYYVCPLYDSLIRNRYPLELHWQSVYISSFLRHFFTVSFTFLFAFLQVIETFQKIVNAATRISFDAEFSFNLVRILISFNLMWTFLTKNTSSSREISVLSRVLC